MWCRCWRAYLSKAAESSHRLGLLAGLLVAGWDSHTKDGGRSGFIVEGLLFPSCTFFYLLLFFFLPLPSRVLPALPAVCWIESLYYREAGRALAKAKRKKERQGRELPFCYFLSAFTP